MAELARSVAAPRDLDTVLKGVTTTTVELLEGAATAGVLLVSKGGKFESLSGTSDLIYEVDRLQEKHNAGPCVEAALDELVVRTDDFEHETRWPQYSREVVKLGVRSSISFKLYTGDRTAGALNVFSGEPRCFDAESEVIGSILAAHAAAAILASRDSQQLQAALLSRDIIGQAKGMLMERFQVDAVGAFDMLRKLSQQMNVRLHEVAQRVVDTR
ncbi:GAF and ANTAR domain-containing protein [Candidatus Mycobacterium wuenschmannii]|uniref:GAF and ANTAR domain-containing protein n=2 Tax=Candidatus Mycobacterium wuenschmannii TaxID=3027808 RepID=A0ABY8VYP1_9MYCO|nr:GAF and ANTAR domain-containing protein [Candidatus Mycobacterium wuenschmannii]WIM88758.1 GAF and ANTAR domain-containing protein [Candidatus Mycobacterium wuenschmannii]